MTKGNPNTPYTMISMTNIDDNLNHESVEYIDIREHEEQITQGYINSFKIIPFYSELISNNILAYNPTFIFNPKDILDIKEINRLFDINKTYLLMCRSGRRSEYLKDVLDYLGYDAYNIGGIIDYKK